VLFFFDLRKIASIKRIYLCDRQGKADTSRPRREGPPLAGRCICHPACHRKKNSRDIFSQSKKKEA
jgi:hypothetical protein